MSQRTKEKLPPSEEAPGSEAAQVHQAGAQAQEAGAQVQEAGPPGPDASLEAVPGAPAPGSQPAPGAGDGAGPAGGGPVDLERALAEARAQASEYHDDLLRAQAELENLRKRSQREVENARKFALERFVGELLSVKDSMELGLSAAAEAGADVSKVSEGLELTLKMLNSVLEKFGVEELNPVDGQFDPEFHQAMSVQEVAGKESGQITLVVQKGCLLNRRLLRPAMVIVAK